MVKSPLVGAAAVVIALIIFGAIYRIGYVNAEIATRFSCDRYGSFDYYSLSPPVTLEYSCSFTKNRPDVSK